MPKFQKKPVVIEAVQFTGSNHREVLSFVYPDLSEDAIVGAETMRLPVVIETLEGDMTASPGDWIIKGVKGEFYPCKPDIFSATYGDVGDTKTGSEPVHVVCVTDEDTGHEAVYVGGDLMGQDATMYGCDVARLTSGMTIQLSHVSLRLPEQQEYPRRFEDCLKFVTDEMAEE